MRGLMRILVPCASILGACDLDPKSVTGTAEDGDSGGNDDVDDDDSATGQGGEGDSDGGVSNPPCLDTTTVLASSAEVSPLGFSADDVLAFAGVRHDTTFALGDEFGDFTIPSAGPPSQLLITVDYQGHEVRYVDAQPDPAWPIDNESCTGRLEIDTILSFATGDYQFAETFPFPSVLVATSADQVTFHLEVEPHGFLGSFSADDIVFEDDGTEVEFFWIDGTIRNGDPATTTGGLMLIAALGPGHFLEAPIGEWPTP